MHAVVGEALFRVNDYVLHKDGTRVIKDAELVGVLYRCEAGDLETRDLTEIANHVVANQFVVKPEPLVRTRKESSGARPYRPRPSR